jgi:hypothetical protein
MLPVKTLRSVMLVGLVCAGATYAVAQPKPSGEAKKPPPSAAASAPARTCEHEHGRMECPLHAAAGIADLTVEDTAQGATIRVSAKRPEDVAHVRELARKLADMSKEKGECEMMEHDGPHAHGMGHDQHDDHHEHH